jgi:hypothetical protein
MHSFARQGRWLARWSLAPVAVLVAVISAGPMAASAASGTSTADTAASAANNPGDPPLPEYPGLSPQTGISAAVTTTAKPCDDNGSDKDMRRSDAIARARSWLSVGGVPYSQERCYRNQYGDYRTDCSGFVAMAWGLGGSGSYFWTANLDTRSHPIARSDLRPGDALLRHTGDPDENHVALFVRWENEAHTKPVVIEQTGSANTVERSWSASTASVYTPVRYDNIVEDQASPPAPSSGVSGDFNGDNKDDIIARNAATGELWLYPGTGSFTNDALLGQRIRVGFGWGKFDQIFSGDYNRDGNSDIVARQPSDGTLWVYPGTGSFTTDRVLGSPTRIGTGWNQFNTIFSGDYNHDGKSDLIARRTTDNELVLYPGNGTLTTDTVVGPAIRVGIGWGSYDAFTAGDFNQDGNSDVVARRTTDGVLLLWPGTGSFTTDRVLNPAIQIGIGWSGMNAFTSGDFNQDAKADIVVRKTEDDTLWMYPGTGTHTTNQILIPAKRMGTGWGGMDRIT